jgi:hypothetical protein
MGASVAARIVDRGRSPPAALDLWKTSLLSDVISVKGLGTALCCATIQEMDTNRVAGMIIIIALGVLIAATMVAIVLIGPTPSHFQF